MAEYSITYQQMQELVTKYIEQRPEHNELISYRSVIMTAITAHEEYSEESNKKICESLELWNNQIERSSNLLIGTRYFVIKDSVLTFIGEALCSGLITSLLSGSTDPLRTLVISTGPSLVSKLIELLLSVKELDNFDFCIYLQAVTHFHLNKEFCMDDVCDWFSCKCNMHNHKWDCEHYFNEQDSCCMLNQDNCKKALESLCNKKILSSLRKDGVYYYRFRL